MNVRKAEPGPAERRWFVVLVGFFIVGNLLLYVLARVIATVSPQVGMWLMTDGKLVLLLVIFSVPAGGVVITKRGNLLTDETPVKPFAWAMLFVYLLVPVWFIIVVR